ncbi:hypothetical protein [Aromatoleum sp.]|uniref:hypothetical protein n=1 Tax=Aromatoleum sp. TaxID=2307007 RepID=UPI002FCBC523
MKPSPFHPVQISLGLVVWSVWFVALYAGLAVACERAPQAPGAGGPIALNVGFGLFTLATAGLLALSATACLRALRREPERPPRERFVARVGAAVHLIALAATLFIGVPLLGLPPCV